MPADQRPRSKTKESAISNEEIKQTIKQVRRCFYHKGTRKDNRVHRIGKWLRFARSLIKFLREAPKYLILRALYRSPLFLCDKNAFLLDYLIDRGELTPSPAQPKTSPPRDDRVMTVTATRLESHSFRRLI
jgi:hypothetical protein